MALAAVLNADPILAGLGGAGSERIEAWRQYIARTVGWIFGAALFNQLAR